MAHAPAPFPARTAAPAATSAAAPRPASDSGPVPILQARDLRHAYGGRGRGTVALDGLDLDIGPTEAIAVMGPSGCGKTTLLHALAGIITPTGGWVAHAGSPLSGMSDAARTRLRRSTFGFVFQDGQLLPELTALENVILPRMLDGARRRTAATGAARWMDQLGLAGMHDRRPGQLSGGQAQRVAIARALAGRPSVVFADEPTGALDQATGTAVLQVLTGACREAGTALVMVTHDPAVASVCERTIVMRDGRTERQFHRDGRAGQGEPATRGDSSVLGRQAALDGGALR